MDAPCNTAHRSHLAVTAHSSRCLLDRLQLGDTSLPSEQPDMIDDEFLQQLHHVLLEVRSISYPPPLLPSSRGVIVSLLREQGFREPSRVPPALGTPRAQRGKGGSANGGCSSCSKRDKNATRSSAQGQKANVPLLSVHFCCYFLSFSSVSLLRRSSSSCPCSQTQIHVEEGAMVCPNCKHVYPISNGIPNMVSPPLPFFHSSPCCPVY